MTKKKGNIGREIETETDKPMCKELFASIGQDRSGYGASELRIDKSNFVSSAIRIHRKLLLFDLQETSFTERVMRFC